MAFLLGHDVFFFSKESESVRKHLVLLFKVKIALGIIKGNLCAQYVLKSGFPGL